MPVPSTARKRWSKSFLIYGNAVEPRIQNQNPDESDPNTGEAYRFGPICRIDTGASGGGSLMFAWKNVARQFSAGNSFQQPVGGQSQSGLTNFQWSGTGSPTVGTPTDEEATFTWGSAGLYRIECEVEDDNGITETGRRWVRVVDLPTGANPPITAFTWDPIVGQLQDRGWGGYSVRITVVGGQYVNLFQRTMQVAIYREEFEGDSPVPVSTGEIFSGFVISPEVEIDPYTDRIVFTAGTTEQLIAMDGMDTAYHTFFDKVTIETGTETLDPFGSPYIPAWALELIYPFHKIDTLTILKAVYHVLRYHITLKIGGTEYGLAQVIDLIVPWWNLGDTADYVVYGLNLPMGRIIDGLIGMIPHGQTIVYCNELSQIAYGPIQTAQNTPDATVDSVDEDLVYMPLRPIDGPDAVVRQVITVQIPSSLKVGTVTPQFVKYPASPASQGGIITPSQPYWFTTGTAGTAIAKAIYDDRNATKRVEFHVAGHPFRIFNRVSITITGQAGYDWSGKLFFVERDTIERNHEWLGGIRSRYLAREVGG